MRKLFPFLLVTSFLNASSSAFFFPHISNNNTGNPIHNYMNNTDGLENNISPPKAKDSLKESSETLNAIEQSITSMIDSGESALSSSSAGGAEENGSGKKKNLSEQKLARIKKKSRGISSAAEEAAEDLSKIVQQENMLESDTIDSSLFKRHALESLSQLSTDLNVTKTSSNSSPDSMENGSMSVLDDFLGDLSKKPSDIQENFMRDYSAPCPQKFFKIGTDCWPSGDYSGNCHAIQKNLAIASDIEKQIWENRCGSFWRDLPETCVNGINWYKRCPVGWIESSGNECTSPKPSNLEGCPNSMKFYNIPIERKKELAKKCFLRWPCIAENCPRNYAPLCPMGWTSVRDGICGAPKKYMGPCPRYANLKGFSEKLKINFEVVCFVSWPCRSSCERDFTATCPLGWIQLDNEFCSAPSEYPGPLPAVYTFRYISPAVREALSKKLNLYYPCQDRTTCLRDFSVPCPIDWKVSLNGRGCIASSKVSTPCQGVVEFNAPNLSIQDKENLALSCLAQYPCHGEYDS